MKIIHRYYLKEFFKFCTIFLFCFTAVSMVVEFFDKANEFYKYQPPVYVIIQYLLLQTPGTFLYALPFASLFSLLITLGIASKWKEIIIVRASGGSAKSLFATFLALGACFTLLALLLGETVVPASTKKAAWIRKVRIMHEQPKIIFRENALWLKGTDKSLIRIEGFIPGENKVLKPSIFIFSSQFGLKERIEANEAFWISGVWELKNVTVFNFMNNTALQYDSLKSSVIEEPSIFSEELERPEEMNFTELYKYYKRLEKAGFKNLKYVVRLYEKLAYPMINFIMILFGLSLALHSKWGGGIKAAGFGVIISIIYWLIYSTSISFGNMGVLPAWLAPWLSPSLFGVVGGAMYMRIRE